MKKKWFALALSAFLLVGSIIPFAYAEGGKTSADFTDLKDLDAATKAKFDALISAGVFDGVSEGTFGLKEEMNRAQFAKVAALIFGLNVDSSLKTSSFADVLANDAANGYALPYIEAVKKAGITDGTGAGTFNPAGKVTKEQLAAFLVKGLGKKEDAQNNPGVNDSTVSDWAKGYVALSLQMKLLSNGTDGKFGGTGNATRDLLIQPSYEVGVQTGVLIPVPTPTSTPKPTINYPLSTPNPSPTPTPTPASDANLITSLNLPGVVVTDTNVSNVTMGTLVSTLHEAISVSEGASFVIYQYGGVNPAAQNSLVSTGMIVRVTAENGTNRDYAIMIAPYIPIPTACPGGGMPPACTPIPTPCPNGGIPPVCLPVPTPPTQPPAPSGQPTGDPNNGGGVIDGGV
ncbi:S-layer homology domain-containing protein [Paenibacillus sp. GCM10027627]|uniref:S-layer homology domain-containing protein n=1 Tax=unclassified Paenibacillus TaxID=185978 RepID=UPI0036379981